MAAIESNQREKEIFEPLVPGEVRMYSCGPTVYNHLHIGNMRTFLWGDVLRRYLEWRGLRVKQCAWPRRL